MNPYLSKTKLIKILNFLGFFKLYGRLLVNLKTGDYWKILLSENDFKVIYSFADLQVKLLLEKSLWRNILLNLKIKVTPRKPLFLHFTQDGPEEVRLLIKWTFLILGQQKIKNPLILPATIYLCIFEEPLWIS